MKIHENHWFFKDFVVFRIKDSGFEDFNHKDIFFELKFLCSIVSKTFPHCSAGAEFV